MFVAQRKWIEFAVNAYGSSEDELYIEQAHFDHVTKAGK